MVVTIHMVPFSDPRKALREGSEGLSVAYRTQGEWGNETRIQLNFETIYIIQWRIQGRGLGVPSFPPYFG